MVSLPISGPHSTCIDDSIDLMNSAINSYFHDNFGYSEDFSSDELVNKCKELPKKVVKSKLNIFKRVPGLPNEISYVIIGYALPLTIQHPNLP